MITLIILTILLTLIIFIEISPYNKKIKKIFHIARLAVTILLIGIVTMAICVQVNNHYEYKLMEHEKEMIKTTYYYDKDIIYNFNMKVIKERTRSEDILFWDIFANWEVTNKIKCIGEN